MGIFSSSKKPPTPKNDGPDNDPPKDSSNWKRNAGLAAGAAGAAGTGLWFMSDGVDENGNPLNPIQRLFDGLKTPFEGIKKFLWLLLIPVGVVVLIFIVRMFRS